MKCPYCTSDISDEALACPHCAHDLYLLKPLLARVAELEDRLRQRLEPAAPSAAGDEVAACDRGTMPAEEQVPASPVMAGQLREWALLWLLPLLLLLAAHALITVAYDLNTLYLRVVSLIVPLPFGFLLMARGRNAFGASLLAAFGMAALAVIGMSWVTSWVDHTPVLPQNPREWREFIEYAASVGLSYATGMVLGAMFRHHQDAQRRQAVRGLALKLAKLVSSGQANADKLEAVAKKVNDLGGTLTAAATTAASVYMGLQGVLRG